MIILGLFLSSIVSKSHTQKILHIKLYEITYFTLHRKLTPKNVIINSLSNKRATIISTNTLTLFIHIYRQIHISSRYLLIHVSGWTCAAIIASQILYSVYSL